MFPVSTQTSLDEIEDAGDSEFGGEFLGPHRSFLSRRASSPIAANRRHHEIWLIAERKTVISRGTGDDTNSVRPRGPSGNITPPAMP